jgi:hypothetical protein
MVRGSTIRNFFQALGGFILVVLLLPVLTPFFSNMTQSIGGVPGAFMLLALPVILLSILYGMYQTSKSTGVRRR